MDIERQDLVRKRRMRRILYGTLAVLILILVTAGLKRLKPAAPSVERGTVLTDKVARGPMLRQVRGPGTLVPEEIRWIPAVNEGRVERILVMAGAAVRADTVLLVLNNPQLAQETLDAELRLKAAQAEYRNLQVQLESQVLNQKSVAARADSDYNEAKLRAETDEALAKLGVLSDLNLKVSRERAQLLGNQRAIEDQRLAAISKGLQAQLSADQARIEQVRAVYDLKRAQLEALRIRASANGVLQESPLKVGQWVTAGTTLAKVVQPERLKAELKIPETQAKDLALGLPAAIDTRNGIIAGKVMRIDPAAVGGTVTVDVSLEGALPAGARPDMNVDGTIDIERLTDVLFVGRPAFGQEKSTVTMFKLDAAGREAFRVQVRLGRSSVSAIEIVEDLKAGDEVILSDMTRWDGFDHIRLE